jgi:hypothetical protein
MESLPALCVKSAFSDQSLKFLTTGVAVPLGGQASVLPWRIKWPTLQQFSC